MLGDIGQDFLEKKIRDVGFIACMSMRAINGLTYNNIITIRDLLSCSEKDLLKMKNLGRKSAAEIMSFIEDLKNQLGEKEIRAESESSLMLENNVLKWAWNKNCDADTCVIFDLKHQPCCDCALENFSFPTKIKESLLKLDVSSFRQLLKTPINAIAYSKGVGDSCLEKMRDIICFHTNIEGDINQMLSKSKSIVSVFNPTLYSGFLEKIQLSAALFIAKNVDFDEPSFLKSPEVISIVEDCLCQNGHKKTLDEIDLFFPNEIKEKKDFVLQKLLVDERIEIKDGVVRRRRPSFKKYVNNIKDPGKQEILKDLISGQTLRSVAKKLNVSRERTRQIVDREFSRMPIVEEDSYLFLFSEYDVSCDELLFILQSDIYSAFYIKRMWKNGKIPSEKLLHDERIPVEFRKRYEQYLNRDMLNVDGRRIKKNFNDIIDFIIENECEKYTTIDELKNKYYSLLSANAIEISPRLEFQIAAKMKISARNDVLWVQGSKFRYYDISETDFNSLVSILNIEALSDVEISTKYFLDRYSKELSEFDIRDEYELHNLLRKRLKCNMNIEFLRMPNIRFGNASRKNQVYELLEQEAPINADALAKKYEDMYGVRASAFFVTYADEIDVYLEKGVYSLNYPQVNEEEFSFLLGSLEDDVYEMQYIKRIFHKRFPDANLNKINSYTLKKLGFFIYSSIVYRAEKENFDAFFKIWLGKRDVADFSNLLWLIKNPVAYNRLCILKGEYEWFEFEPNQYVSLDKLCQIINGKDDVVSYTEAAASFANGKLFSIVSLRKNGFCHKLNELGFGEFFYESILKYADCLKYCRFGNRYVFAKYPQEVSFITLIKEIMEPNKSIGIYYLVDLLEKEYGIFAEKRKICDKIANSDLFFSQTMEKVYIDYESFLGDL